MLQSVSDGQNIAECENKKIIKSISYELKNSEILKMLQKNTPENGLYCVLSAFLKRGSKVWGTSFLFGIEDLQS